MPVKRAPLRLKLRNPLDVLAERCRDMPISTADVIAEVKRLAIGFSRRGISAESDEAKGEIARLVAAVYDRDGRGIRARISEAEIEGSAGESRTTVESDGFEFSPIDDEDERTSRRDRRSFAEDDSVERDQREVEGRGEGRSTVEARLLRSERWLREKFGAPLKTAMTEIVAKKPYDPVSYLGFWLLSYREREEEARRREEAEVELPRSTIRPPSLMEEDKRLTEKAGEAEEGGGRRDWNFQQYETQPGITFI